MYGTTTPITTTKSQLKTAPSARPPPFNAYGRYAHNRGPIDIANPAM